MAVYQNGIDVSRYQGNINWGRVAAAGKQFAIVRVGSSNSGGLYVDPYFLQNVNGAKAAGLRVGAYYYTYARTRAAVANELTTFLNVMQGLQLEYPVFVDVEDASLTSLGRAELTSLVQYAMDILYQRKWYAGWYSYTNYINSNLNAAALSRYPLWVADYRATLGYNGSYAMWQYTGSGVVNGISGACDLNRSYRDFLRRFAVWHEEPHLDPEEFDLGFYSYGLRTYGKLPLIEPLESREVKKIRDFVIVVDTSESTAGELVKSFLKETFALLTSQDSFFRKCRILVMQADNAVREETWLTDLDALDRYTARFTLVGGGGTDFRPAFARIAALRREGSLRDLQGVLYFTDGKGIYPAKRPPFEVAFLFLEDGTPPPDVPPWAMRLVLQPEEFTPDTDPKGR